MLMNGIEERDIRYSYKSNLPFTNSINVNIDEMKFRIHNKLASLCIIDGLMGTGKSTLAVEILEYYQKADLDYTCQYAMGGNDFLNKLKIVTSKGLTCIIYDEGGDLDKRRSSSSFNANLNRVFQTFRAFKVFIIIVVPLFDVLDNYMFSAGVPRLLLHTERNSMKYAKVKIYGYAEMCWLKKRMTDPRCIPKLKAYADIKANTIGFFKPLHKEKQHQLDLISTGAKRDSLTTSIKKQNNLVGYDDLINHFGVSKRRLQQIIKKLRNVETQILQRKKYFKDSIIKLIERRIGNEEKK